MTKEEIEKKAFEAYPGQLGPTDKPCLDDDYRVTLKQREAYIKALTEMSNKEIEKNARLLPGMISNFGNCVYMLSVELTQEEIARLNILSGSIKVKLLCE